MRALRLLYSHARRHTSWLPIGASMRAAKNRSRHRRPPQLKAVAGQIVMRDQRIPSAQDAVVAAVVLPRCPLLVAGKASLALLQSENNLLRRRTRIRPTRRAAPTSAAHSRVSSGRSGSGCRSSRALRWASRRVPSSAPENLFALPHKIDRAVSAARSITIFDPVAAPHRCQLVPRQRFRREYAPRKRRSRLR